MPRSGGAGVLARMRRTLATFAAVAAAGLGAAPAVQADSGRPSLPACRTPAHFVIHCAPGTVSDAYLDGAVGDFEEAYARDVVGGGADNNAGLRAPVADDDGKTDVYIMVPPGRAGFSGGTVFRDPSHVSGRGQAAFMFMTPDLDRGGFRFRAGHEFMHVLLRAYFGFYGPIYEESLANWAAEHALPDINAGDNNMRSPEYSFDCVSAECGAGYWQWLFFQRQTELFGDGFVASLLEQSAPAPTLSGDFMSPYLRDALNAQTGRGDGIRVQFADYARRVWDPTAWRTTAVREIYDISGTPAVDPDLGLWAGFPQTGPRTATVDHLAARYARLNLGEAGTDDDLRVTVQPPPGQVATPDVLYGPELGTRRDVALAPDGSGGFTTTIEGPFGSNTVIVPMVNDSETADGQTFTWHAELIRADAETLVDRRQHLRTALKKGLTVKITAGKPLAITVSASVDRTTARKYKLGKRQTRVTSLVRKNLGAGTTAVKLKFTSKARTRLAKAKRVPFIVAGTGTFPRGTQVELDWVGSIKR